jgi:DNA polymerase III subunit epsilon
MLTIVSSLNSEEHELKTETAKKAKALLSSHPVFLDTETTGMGPQAEVIEICIIDTDGSVLLESLLKPTVPISLEAQKVHGLSEADLRDAPTFAALLPEITRVLEGRHVVIYNAAYDIPIMLQSALAHGLDGNIITNSHCAMLLYAEFVGYWDDFRGGYRWHKLINAARRCGIVLPPRLHRARADAEITRQLLLHMAGFSL